MSSENNFAKISTECSSRQQGESESVVAPDPLGGDHRTGPWQGHELLVKKALHIQMTPVVERLNRDGGLEVSGCWTAVM